ncbi:MAG: cytochrome C oxidase subunit IV family protein [Pyrinomonadaceae bacterium]
MADQEIHNTHSHTQEHEAHIGIPGYFGIFGILVVGTILTYYVATIDLDFIFAGANTLVALLIAFTKMTFVVLYFMHVRWQSKLIWLTALAGFFWLAIMFAFTMQDYPTRGTGVFTN